MTRFDKFKENFEPSMCFGSCKDYEAFMWVTKTALCFLFAGLPAAKECVHMLRSAGDVAAYLRGVLDWT